MWRSILRFHLILVLTVIAIGLGCKSVGSTAYILESGTHAKEMPFPKDLFHQVRVVYVMYSPSPTMVTKRPLGVHKGLCKDFGGSKYSTLESCPCGLLELSPRMIIDIPVYSVSELLRQLIHQHPPILSWVSHLRFNLPAVF